MRRVEALVGLDAFRFLAREHVLVGQVTEALKLHSADELPERVAALTTRLRDAERELERLQAAAVLQAAPQLAAGATDVGGVAVVAHARRRRRQRRRRAQAGDRRARSASTTAGRPSSLRSSASPATGPVLVVAVNEAARGRGVKAGELVRVGAGVLGGGGGGKDDLAQGGGTDASKVDAALAAVRARIAEVGRVLVSRP